MDPETIAVLGAQGHFGQALYTRLRELRGGAVVIIPTADKYSNREIASRSDTVMLTVRPDQVEAVLREITDQPDRLKPTARIVSFAARYPLTSILDITKRPSARVMADIDWNMSTYVLGGGFSEDDFRSEFTGLTRMEPLRAGTDTEIDTFAVLLVHLLVVSVLDRQGAFQDATGRITFISEKLGMSSEQLRTFHTKGEPAEVLATAATPGGLTEAAVMLIRANPSVSPEELHASLAEKFVRKK